MSKVTRIGYSHSKMSADSVVGHTDAQAEQRRERAQQAFGLPPGPTKGQAQQVPSLDRHVRVVAGSAPLACAGRMPGRERLRRDPDREAAALLECPVVLRPIRYPLARPGDLVTARFIGLVGHRLSGKRGSGPIRPTATLPKPRVAILHQRLNRVQFGSCSL